MSRGRVVVVGLDAVTPQLAEPWMKEGKLPNLARIVREGAYGRLLSTIPPFSPQAWSSFLTGKNPGKHGIYGFAHRKAGTYDWTLTTSRDRIEPDLGQVISARGKSAGFLSVPLTYPPVALNGFMVSGMGTPGARAEFTYPPELKSQLLREFGEESLFEPPIVDREPLEYFSELEKFVERNCVVFEWLWSRFADLDYYMAVFISPDRIQHVAWHYMEPGSSSGVRPALRDAILRVYQRTDEAVGRIASMLDPDDTIIVMSDHGAGPYKRFVDLNSWLAQQGFLTFSEGPAGRSDRMFSNAYRVWRRGPRSLFSPRQRRRIRQWLPKSLGDRIAMEWKGARLSQVDWSRTQAFSEGAGGFITLNLQARDPQGIVRPEGREDTLRRIERDLYQLRDPDTHDPVVERVWRAEEIYAGVATQNAPHLIIDWFQERYHSRVVSDPRGGVFRDPGKWRTTRMTHSARHRREGVVFARGPSVIPGTRIPGAGIIDLAPTILALMDLPLLPDFDGRVLKELTVGIEEAEVEKLEAGPPADDTDVYSEEEATHIEDLLRGLGYAD